MLNLFQDPELVRGYAESRPPVHAEVIRTLREAYRLPGIAERALDIGCGCGLSTRAICGIALLRVGIEPVPSMARAACAVDPTAAFLAGQAERLPFPDRSFDLLSAAGSLNYIDLAQFGGEARRVLAANGVLLAYDFSVGDASPASLRLADWFGEFMRRYPRAQDGAVPLDPREIVRRLEGFGLDWARHFDVELPLNSEFYARYLMTETNVAWAVRQGATLEEIRNWVRSSVAEIFGGGLLPVRFPAYALVLRPV